MDVRVLGILFFLTTILCLASCKQSRTEPRLQGTWKSNKPETVAVWKREGILSDKFIDSFEKGVLGKMTETYKGNQLIMAQDNWKEVTKYQIIESGADYVVIEHFSKVYERNLRWKIRFVENGYWTSSDDPIKGYTEKFDLISR
jgi:hypothetical protein